MKEQHQNAKENFSEKYKEILTNFSSQKFLKDVNIEFLKKVNINNNKYFIFCFL